MSAPGPLTLEQLKERNARLQAMDREVDCPKGCDEGWLATSGCGGHICDWPGHDRHD